ncbi:unnamed protein product, partial [Rotaria sordida]
NMDRNEKYPSNWISSDTPNSPLTSQSQNIQHNLNHVRIPTLILNFYLILKYIISGSPPNISIEDSQDDNNFNIQLPSSYQFKLQLVDL